MIVGADDGRVAWGHGPTAPTPPPSSGGTATPAPGGEGAAGAVVPPSLGRADAPTPSAGAETSGPGDAAVIGPGALARERDLIRRAAGRDASAFEELVRPWMQPAFQLAVRLLGDRQLAEDVTQDALTKAFLGLRHFRGEARFGTWIFRIVHNACTDALRQRARHPSVPVAFGAPGPDGGPGCEPADARPGPEEVVSARLGREAILAAVAALPVDHRAVVVLRDVQGLSYEEVAAVLGQSIGTVKSRLHRARASLRAALDPPAAAQSGSGARGEPLPPTVVRSDGAPAARRPRDRRGKGVR